MNDKMISPNYNKLWKLMIDRSIKKKDLQALTGISSATLAKMGKGEFVSMETVSKICNVLNCDVDDVVSFF